MQNGRKRIAALVATLTTLTTSFVGVTLATQSAHADPDLKTVKKQVADLEHKAEIASERYNDAKVKLDDTRTRLAALNSDLRRQEKVVDAMRRQVAAIVVDQYQGELSTTSQVVLSNDPDKFLDNLGAVTSYNDQRGQVMHQYATQLDRLQLRKNAVNDEAGRLRALERQMAANKAEIDKKTAKAKEVLSRLEADARKKVLAAGADYSGPIPDVAAAGRAAQAVHYALAQVGKAYVYGAAGPNAFDCSGLTMRAWGSAGVGLPHSSRAQTGSGMHVSESQLRPGDLVFFYSPVSHVGMYIGNGMIVHAANPSAGVRISPLHSMPYSGAVRPG